MAVKNTSELVTIYPSVNQNFRCNNRHPGEKTIIKLNIIFKTAKIRLSLKITASK